MLRTTTVSSNGCSGSIGGQADICTAGVDPGKTCVDIVLPTHGRPGLLRQALTSVLAQTHCAFLVWIVNDKPEDQVLLEGIVQRFADPRLKLISPGKRNGANIARNIGIAAGNYPIVAFLDDDDLWLPEKLEEHVKVHTRNPELALVFSDFLIQLDRPFRFRFAMGGKALANAPTASIGTSRVSVRRVCLKEIGGFDPELMAYQDFDAWYRIMRQFRWRRVDRSLNILRIHSGNRITRLDTVEEGGRQVLAKYAYDPGLDQIRHMVEERRFLLAIRDRRSQSKRDAFILALREKNRPFAERIGATVLAFGGEPGYQFVRAMFRWIGSLSPFARTGRTRRPKQIAST